MNINQVQIVNLALFKAGARGTIASLEEASPNGEVALALWDIVFQRVLAERDWKFAKVRAVLVRSTVTPTYGYEYAYVVPSDFVRLIKAKKSVEGIVNPAGSPYVGMIGVMNPQLFDTPVWPPGFPYIFETVLDSEGNATKCLLANYDNTSIPLMINYIKVITDLTLLTPAFVESLALALAAEICIPVTEDKNKAAELKQDYRESLNVTEALNEQADFLADEAGSTAWVDAGR